LAGGGAGGGAAAALAADPHYGRIAWPRADQQPANRKRCRMFDRDGRAMVAN